MADLFARKAGKCVLGLFVYGLTSGIVIAAAVFWLAAYEFQKPGPLKEPTIIVIPSGSSIGGIADQLSYHSVIGGQSTDKAIFKIMGRLTGRHTSLKAGEYEFQPGISMKQALFQMEEGKTLGRRVTVREGLTNWETKILLKTNPDLKSETEILLPLEGAYLPETYSYQKGDTYLDILSQMQKAMRETIFKACGFPDENLFNSSEWIKLECPNASAPLKTTRDVLTLASIVEKETGVASERARIAGVFLNRLKRGIPLQTDPSVIYALTKGQPKNDGKGPLGRRLLRKDLDVDSPYNTYKYAGLPPGPICNPGKDLIEAVLHPEEHEYIYFVADGSGGHVFAKTLAEHNANVAKWRKIRREKGL